MYELAQQKKYQAQLENSLSLGRNYTLFDRLRFWAYNAVRQFRKMAFKSWHSEVISRASSLNDFSQPLSYNEVGILPRVLRNGCGDMMPNVRSNF